MDQGRGVNRLGLGVRAVQEQQALEDNWWDFSDDDGGDDGGDGGEGEAGGMAPVVDLTGASDDE